MKKEKKPADSKKKDWKRGKAGKKSNSSGGGGAQLAPAQHEGNDSAFTPEVIAALADLGLKPTEKRGQGRRVSRGGDSSST